MECPTCGIPTRPGDAASGGARYSYTVRLISEGVLGTLLLGRSKIRPERVERMLNEMGARGYRNSFQVLEKRRFLLFWQRETLIITFERSV